jgi:hypothetical protein
MAAQVCQPELAKTEPAAQVAHPAPQGCHIRPLHLVYRVKSHSALWKRAKP